MSENEPRLNVLVPFLGRGDPGLRLSIASAVIEKYGGSATVLSVVDVPEQRSLSEAALIVRRRRALLRKMAHVHDAGAFNADVRTAHSVAQGIRDAARETQPGLLLLGWELSGGMTSQGTFGRLFSDPPCDCAAVKQGEHAQATSILVSLRGGPHAGLALRIAEAVALQNGAILTLLHINLSGWSQERRLQELLFFQRIRDLVTYPGARDVEVDAESVESALIAEGSKHDLVVMGAAGRYDRSSFLVGKIPEGVARAIESSVMVVRTQQPVTAQMFGLAARDLAAPRHRDISQLVDSWFAENTFHSHEFRNVRHLVDAKERQGVSISVVLPTLNEEKTVGKIISTIQKELVQRYRLIDEIVVIDSDSQDRTTQIAESLGVPIFRHADLLPDHGSFVGKGEALWKSLQATSGDIVVWIDSDITGIHPKFAYGLVGPLLTAPHVGFVKGFYRRPLNLGGQLLSTGGGRVTELTARPLINLFFPELSGVVQPLAGEMAGRRSILEALPFFTGYGVETGLLIDILSQFGLRCIAQVDLEYRVHRNQSLLSLSKMAFAIVQVVMKRLEDRSQLELIKLMNTSMKLIHYSPAELFLEVMEIEEHERPPIKSLLEYVNRGGSGGGQALMTVGAVEKSEHVEQDYDPR
jgi:nucleotide-binding universal stress UspA family protein